LLAYAVLSWLGMLLFGVEVWRRQAMRSRWRFAC
jgi:hypothetical protein